MRKLRKLFTSLTAFALGTAGVAFACIAFGTAIGIVLGSVYLVLKLFGVQ